jgi:hypothetical protein
VRTIFIIGAVSKELRASTLQLTATIPEMARPTLEAPAPTRARAADAAVGVALFRSVTGVGFGLHRRFGSRYVAAALTSRPGRA